MSDGNEVALLSRAVASGSPVIQALVAGHVRAGLPAMAELALNLHPAAVAMLDQWFAGAMEQAEWAGAAAVLEALRDGE